MPTNCDTVENDKILIIRSIMLSMFLYFINPIFGKMMRYTNEVHSKMQMTIPQ
jgi:hypothetical protein